MKFGIIDDIRKFGRVIRFLLSENIELKGSVHIYEARADSISSLDPKYIKQAGHLVYSNDNLIVTVGKEAIIDALLGLLGANYDFYEVGVGSGSNAPSANDTTLQTAILWKVATDRYRVSTEGFVGVTFGASEGNGTWAEAGCRNRAGTLISRAAVTYTKTIDYVVTVEWKYTW